MFRAAGTACAVILALASCSDDPGEAASSTGTTEPDAATSVLEELTGDDMCAALSVTTIERELGVTVEGSDGNERGRAPVMRAPYFLSRHCSYDTGELPGLTTSVATKWDEETSDDEVLDGAFTDVTAEAESAEPVGPYEQLPDLGVTAGFGADAVLSKAGVAGQVLAVVLAVGAERLLVQVSTTGRATLEQLRPLADELVANLESARS